MKFSDWLVAQMNEKDINQAELARSAGLSRAAISNYVRDLREPDIDATMRIARALKLPPETVLRAAGILPPLHEPHTVAEEITRYKISELDENQLGEVLQFIEFIQDRDDKSHRREFIERHTREGATPPEMVNKK
jgi:transcriptional regulator with XRE-family HTH domain